VAQDADRGSIPGPGRPGSAAEPPAGTRESIVGIGSDADIIVARQRGRSIAAALGFDSGEMAIIATAISELARNIVKYAGRGEIVLRPGSEGARRFLDIVSRDRGPGIADIPQAMRDGFSTSGGLGLGLPGVRRLMDEFAIRSTAGEGTTITVRKWRR
jgi:serine/threonine-protein kinase RsbT